MTATKPAPKNEGKVPRFVELIRVSSKKQGDADTPELQRRALDKLRAQRPGVLVERIEDGAAGLSGALGLNERPDLQRLLKLAQARAFDEVRCYDIDRLTRSDDPRERFAIFGMVQDAGAIIVDRNGRETDPSEESGMGEIDFFLRSFFSAQERKKIVGRTMDGRKRTAAGGGKPHGRTLDGFTYDVATKTWGIDEKRAPLIRQIFQWSADGLSARQIRDRLNEEGIPSPKGYQWKRGCLTRLLTNRTYRGEMTYTFGPETFRSEVPCIVPPDLWDRVQTALAARYTIPVRDHYQHQASLRGRAVCGVCNAPMHVIANRRLIKRVCHYICATKTQGGKCSNFNHRIDAVDQAVWETVCARLSDAAWLKASAEKMQSKAGRGEWKQQIKACEKKLAEIQKREQGVLSMLGEGLAPAACREQLKDLARNRETVTRSLELARSRLAAQEQEVASLESIESYVNKIRSKLTPDAPFAVRESVLRAATPEDGKLVALKPDGTIDLRGILAVPMGETLDQDLTRATACARHFLIPLRLSVRYCPKGAILARRSRKSVRRAASERRA